MRTATAAKELKDLRVKAYTVALLTRVLGPGLIKRAIESIELQERIQARRVSPRRRRLRRALKIGAYGVSLATAGVAVARLARHSTEPVTRAPDVPTATPATPTPS